MSYWIFIIYLAFVEVYSAATMVVAKRKGMPRYGLCMIPLVAFFYMDALSGGFKVFGIRVTKWGKTVVLMSVLSVLAYLFTLWGEHNINAEDAASLTEIMLVPMIIFAIVFYMGVISSTLMTMQSFRARFKHDTLVCMLFVTAPFLLAFATAHKIAPNHPMEVI